MDRPASFAEDHPEVLPGAVRGTGLAALAPRAPDRIAVTPAPVVARLDAGRMVSGAHVAGADAPWRTAGAGTPALRSSGGRTAA